MILLHRQELVLLEQDGGIRSLTFSSRGCELVSLIGQVQEVRRLATCGRQVWKEAQMDYLRGPFYLRLPFLDYLRGLIAGTKIIIKKLL